jgi:hypothetical protein
MKTAPIHKLIKKDTFAAGTHKGEHERGSSVVLTFPRLVTGGIAVAGGSKNGCVNRISMR